MLVERTDGKPRSLAAVGVQGDPHGVSFHGSCEALVDSQELVALNVQELRKGLETEKANEKHTCTAIP